jgi:hypothetical protein
MAWLDMGASGVYLPERISVSGIMPTISMFYGLIIRMYYFDNQQHNKPHIHVHYQEYSAVVSIPDGLILEGKLPKSKQNLLMPGLKSIRKI